MALKPLDALKMHPLFAWISSAPLSWLADRCTEKSFKEGDVVYERDSEAEAVFLILEGEVEFASADDRAEKPVLKAGKSFGESSLVDVRKRVSRATARSNVRLLILPHSVLLEFARLHPDPYSIVITNLARILARRLRLLNMKRVEGAGKRAATRQLTTSVAL